MVTANLKREDLHISDGLDSIVVIQALSELPGGRTLDVSKAGEGVRVVRSGHVLVIDKETGDICPLNITEGKYESLDGRKVAGVLKYSVSINDPRAAIVTAGQINEAASPAPVTDEIKAAMPRIEWLYGK